CDELKPDVLVVTEQGFKNESLHIFRLENYVLANAYCRSTFKGGGVAIFIRNPLKYQPICLNYCTDKDFEVSGIKVYK
ncbi:endonuclease/exonuclease/phosphatase family protein, partial [Klebsiella pneumoniae]|uniref:endonuclease/exonuclease/phosphatase family protein n=1 Tax=Klebsiella pneumoniae TaxID=573 RepID=UPI001C8F8214